MSLYKRGEVWWYKFRFAGQPIRETSKSSSKTVARDAECARRRELELGFNRIERQQAAQLFSIAAENWLKSKRAHLAARSVIIEQANLKHLNPHFGRKLVCDISSDDVGQYQAMRLSEGAAPKTVNLEVGPCERCSARIGCGLRFNRMFECSGSVRMSGEPSPPSKRCNCWRRVSLAGRDPYTLRSRWR